MAQMADTRVLVPHLLVIGNNLEESSIADISTQESHAHNILLLAEMIALYKD